MTYHPLYTVEFYVIDGKEIQRKQEQESQCLEGWGGDWPRGPVTWRVLQEKLAELFETLNRQHLEPDWETLHPEMLKALTAQLNLGRKLVLQPREYHRDFSSTGLLWS